VASGPRPPLIKRLTASQWEAIDVLVAVILAATIVPIVAKLGQEVAPHLPFWAHG
jgi:hypothetical protein